MIRHDCRHYTGKKPCKHKRVCEGCNHYSAIGERILVIKLGALGDLLRTTPILISLKARYPGSQITWITVPEGVPLLRNLEEIDRIWETDSFVSARVLAEEFDLMLNFDKDTPAAELASIARAKVKRGFALSSSGSMIALNEASLYSLELGVDDELKFRENKKTYQAIIHEMAEVPVTGSGPDYVLRLTDEERARAAEWIQRQLPGRPKGPIIGINPGCGEVFATKKWHTDRYVEVAARLHEQHGSTPILFGGKREEEILSVVAMGLTERRIPYLSPGTKMSLREFFAMVSQCRGMICGDTLAMHVALATGVRTLALFTSTCPEEIELYGRGEIIRGSAPCAPCYRNTCNQATQLCADSISVESVVERAAALFELRARDAVGERKARAR